MSRTLLYIVPGNVSRATELVHRHEASIHLPSPSKNVLLTAAALPLPSAAGAQQGTLLFSDEFNTPGLIDESSWTTPLGDAAFFGRTALRNWLQRYMQEQLLVSPAGYVELPLDPFNRKGHRAAPPLPGLTCADASRVIP